MKKITRSIPALFVVAAAALCLSFDNYSQLNFTSAGQEQTELFRSTDDDSGEKYKTVSDICTHGITIVECQTGGNLDCTRSGCEECGL